MANLFALGILLAAVIFMLRRLPQVDLGHSAAFRHRRVWNWLPLGLTYGFLYMGRYNINAAKNAGVLTNEQLGIITFWGALIYGIAFLINGPLTDKYGGRKTIIAASVGSALANTAMGIMLFTGRGANIALFSVLYATNMYFQSFGAVSIVKVNAHWFHVRERGTFGGIFGILISLGIYFAYDWGRLIVEHLQPEWVFFIPAAILAVMTVVCVKLVFDSPADVGLGEYDPADASSGDTGPRLTVWQVGKRMFTNPIIVTIALIELCSGFIRAGVMNWTYIFLKQTAPTAFVYKNWGLLLCVAGILGGVFAGTISDRLFHSRRGPSAAILYALTLAATIGAWLLIATPASAWILILIMLSIIGVHGMLSGTASMDFGGRKNAGVAVGLIDGMVYLGVAAQAIIFGFLVPEGPAQKTATNWSPWLLTIVPVAAIGLALCSRIWNARASSGKPVALAATEPVLKRAA